MIKIRSEGFKPFAPEQIRKLPFSPENAKHKKCPNFRQGIF